MVCKSDNQLVVTRQKGTMVEVKATCCNMSCGYQHRWCSQPYWKDSKMPTGNLLLSMATLFAGGSISKIITIFKHMGLGCVSFTTFFTIQRVRTMHFPKKHCQHFASRHENFQQLLINKMKQNCPLLFIFGFCVPSQTSNWDVGIYILYIQYFAKKHENFSIYLFLTMHLLLGIPAVW